MMIMVVVVSIIACDEMATGGRHGDGDGMSEMVMLKVMKTIMINDEEC